MPSLSQTQNWSHSRTGLLPYSIVQGAQCASGYSPLTSSWQDCKAAAVSLGLKGDSVAHVPYNHPWGTTRPQGCFRSGENKRVHFNRGKGGHAKTGDSMICRRTGIYFLRRRDNVNPKSCLHKYTHAEMKKDVYIYTNSHDLFLTIYLFIYLSISLTCTSLSSFWRVCLYIYVRVMQTEYAYIHAHAHAHGNAWTNATLVTTATPSKATTAAKPKATTPAKPKATTAAAGANELPALIPNPVVNTSHHIFLQATIPTTSSSITAFIIHDKPACVRRVYVAEIGDIQRTLLRIKHS